MQDILDVYQDISGRVEYMPSGDLIWTQPLNRTDWTGRKVGSRDRGGYMYTRFRGRNILLHRLIFFMHHGFLPKIVDHVNRKRSDNRIENLRPCMGCEQNGRNSIPRDGYTSKYKGVSWAKARGRWRASANQDGKSKYLGYYDTEECAAIAYNRFVSLHYGEFAVLNDIEHHRPA